MPNSLVDAALGRLRAAADAAHAGWRPTQWERVSGPKGPGPVQMVPVDFIDLPCGTFDDLGIEPGCAISVALDLALPPELHGVPLKGEALLVTVATIFPTRFRVDGQTLFDDEMPPVASGPALVEVLAAIDPDSAPELVLDLSAPSNELNPGYFYIHFTTPGLRERFSILDTAWAQLLLASRLALTADEIKAVEAAARLVPTDLLTASHAPLSAGLHEMTTALAPVANRAGALRVHCVGHSHIDLAWVWTWEDTRRVIQRDIAAVLSIMDDYPEMTFTHSQAVTYEVLRTEAPDLFERVCNRIAEGRWELATMQWAEGDLNLASGEAQARQLLEGVRYSRELLGASPTVFLAPDTFGHAGNIPQLATSAGARTYYHHRGNPGFDTGGPLWPNYRWEGDDGSRILALSTPTYAAVELAAGELARTALAALDAGSPTALLFYGVGDHGGGPTRQNLDSLRRLEQEPGLPQAFCSTVSGYAADLETTAARLPRATGESARLFEGCYTTHSDIKRQNRHGETLLVTAESLAAAAGIDRRAVLREAWRTVLFNQFHDILDGTSVRDVYDVASAQFEEIAATCATVTEEALACLHTVPGTIAVTNPCGFSRTDLVTLSTPTGTGAVTLLGPDDRALPGQLSPDGLSFVATLAPFATNHYRLATEGPDWPDSTSVSPAPEAAGDLAPALQIETPYFAATLRKDSGILTTFLDKRVGRQLVAWGAARHAGDVFPSARPDLALNVLQLIDEQPHPASSWAFAEIHRETTLLGAAQTSVVEHGPVRTVLEVRHAVRDSTVTQRISFYTQLPRVDFETVVNWQEGGTPEGDIPSLKVAFTAELDTVEAWYETPYAAARRPTNGQEVPALRWADLGGHEYGIALLNESKYGHDALGNRLRLTLLRTANAPDACSDRGEQRFAYSFMPHPGDWRQAGVVQAAAGFNQALLARHVTRTEADPTVGVRTPRLEVDGAVIISSFKKSYDGTGVVVRLYESTGRVAMAALRDLDDARPIWEANIVEDRVQQLAPSGGRLELSFQPWQVRTLLIEDQPAVDLTHLAQPRSTLTTEA